MLPDERLHLFLIVRINHPRRHRHSHGHSSAPSAYLIDFLRHLQISLEATYISQKSAGPPDAPPTAQVVGPPRSSSVGLATPRPTSIHPSIFPPTTPNPVPSTTEGDRKYVQSEGTLLLGSIWGSRPIEQSGERFALVFSELQGIWLGVYEFALDICECIVEIPSASLTSITCVPSISASSLYRSPSLPDMLCYTPGKGTVFLTDNTPVHFVFGTRRFDPFTRYSRGRIIYAQ